MLGEAEVTEMYGAEYQRGGSYAERIFQKSEARSPQAFDWILICTHLGKAPKSQKRTPVQY